MKIHRVTMTGFGPYRGTETVDFDAFDDDGIFLISGKTGAGKTSILDAVTYALFGSVPRYDGAAGDKVRSDYIEPTDPCTVELEFSAADARYRVTRSPAHERPKLRGAGTTTAPATFELAVLEGDVWGVTESRLGNAEVRVEEIVRLNAKQFLQVILLAQGQFQEFLVASSDKRRDLLRMLFDTRRFADYSDALDARARALGSRLASSSTAIRTNTDSLAGEAETAVPDDVDPRTGAGVELWVAAIVGGHVEAADAATAERASSQQAYEVARQALDAARSIHDRQRRRAQALARQVELEVVRSEIDEARIRLAEARRAALVWHRVDAARSAQRALQGAQQRHEAAEQAFRQLLPDQPTEAEGLSSAVQQWSELLGSLRDAALKEQELAGLREAMQAGVGALDEFDEQVRSQTDARSALRTERETLKATMPALEQQAAGVGAADHALITLRARLTAAESADRLGTEIDDAEQRRLEAGKGVTHASGVRDALRERQRAGFAGVLAQALESDQPCLVCGSPTHPSPATLADDHVDDADVEAAEAAYEFAVRVSHEADGDLKELTRRLADERQKAGEGDAVSIQALVDEAEATTARIATAVAALAEAHLAHEHLGTDIDALSDRIDAAQHQRTALVAAAADAKRGHDDAVQSLAETRGAHASVADRLALVTSHVQAGRTLTDTTSVLHEATEQLASAEQLLASALVEHEFGTSAAAEAARLEPRDQAELEQRVTAHDIESKAIDSALASDDLHGLPDDAVDLAAPQASSTQAEAADQQAIAAESTARRSLATIQRLATEIRRALAASAELQAEHAVIDRLASTVRGQTPNTQKMMLETFVLAAELEEIVVAANSRLTTMTGGRYEFLHSDALARGGAQSGLALDVLDAYTGETRAPQSLSGGEKFQASLALALGLAEVLTNRAGGLRLDTLFIDEGFGSLDADTLETTMATLDNLREGGRTIGLISHVEAMKESIPAQVFVDTTDGGWSTIRSS